MTNFIIIDTWNGEGYTDSTAKIMQFRNKLEAAKHCLERAMEQAEAIGTIPYSIQENKYIDGDELDIVVGYGYHDDGAENHGAYRYELIDKPIVGIVLNPCLNDYDVIETVKQWDDAIDMAIEKSEAEDEVMEQLLSRQVDGLYVHSGGSSGDALFFEICLEQEETKELTRENLEEQNKALIERLNACHSTIDTAIDMFKDMGLDLEDSEAYIELLGELAPNEELLRSIENQNK